MISIPKRIAPIASLKINNIYTGQKIRAHAIAAIAAIAGPTKKNTKVI
jgi:hypothetical protein